MTRLDYLALASLFFAVPFGWYSYVVGVGRSVTLGELAGSTVTLLASGLIVGTLLALLFATVAGTFKRAFLPMFAIGTAITGCISHYGLVALT